MRKKIKVITFLTVILLTYSCSPSLKTLNSWTQENGNNLYNKNVLVITRIKNNVARIESERAIKKELLNLKINAEESSSQFSILDPSKKLSEEEIQNAVKKIKEKGFDAIILTTLKDYDETIYTEESGGYYAGGRYYGAYISGFESYYGSMNSIYDGGVYVPSEIKTTISKKYVMETVAYDLNLPKDKALISITTVEIEDPNDIKRISKEYAKKIIQKTLKN